MSRSNPLRCDTFRVSPKRPAGRPIKRRRTGLRVLARTSTRALTRDHSAPLEDLAAPHTPRLFTLQCSIEALAPDRAVGAQLLGTFQVGGVLGEPEVGIAYMTRQFGLGSSWGSLPARRERHVRSPASWSFPSVFYWRNP